MDPLFLDGVDATDVIVVLIKVVAGFGLALVATSLMIWFERKVVADMQYRIGPDVAGPFGILQTLADGIKFFFKEDLRPANADPFVFRLAPYLSAVTAFVTVSVIPIANGSIEIFGRQTLPQVADPPAGILLVLAMSSIAVYGVMLAGWSSGSKWPLIGSVRASAQAISYEAALGMSVVAVVMVSGTLHTSGIVANQDGGIANWGVLATGIIPFIVFLIAVTAELNRPPFDLVEAEQELVGGFHTEYSSIRFALFFLAEFMNVVTMSAIMVTLFFGGPSSPVPALDVIPGPIWFVAKLLVLLFAFVWFRATLPRLRYDQLMDLGWKVLIPLSFGWLILLSAVRIGRDSDDFDWPVAVLVIVVVAIVAVSLLMAALRAGDRAYDAELADQGGRR